MGYVQLPDGLKRLIGQQVAEGRAASEADFVAEAVRLYAEYLETEVEVMAMVERADADMAAGRYVTVSIPEKGEALQRRMVERLHASLARIAVEDGSVKLPSECHPRC